MSENNHNNIPVDKIRAYCQTQPIERLSLFPPGFELYIRPDTDIGMLVEYEPDAPITLIDMARQEREMGEFVGQRIDLHTIPEIMPDLRDELTESARLLYENGA